MSKVQARPTMTPAAPKRPASRWSDLGLRVASALVLVPIALIALLGGGWWWRGLIAALFVALLAEWTALARHVRPAARWSFLAAGLLYAALPGAALVWLRDRPGSGMRDVLFVLVIVWATDIGAYLAGRLVGGVKLAPSISPGKTVSGAAGGLVLAIAAGILLAGSPLGTIPAAILSVVAQAGDLGESAVKRALGVKDSGRSIPGHGGLFDRLDGVLAAAPVAALLALAAQGGVPLWR
jgi:phosphatidate cytidylyltransferase